MRNIFINVRNISLVIQKFYIVFNNIVSFNLLILTEILLNDILSGFIFSNEILLKSIWSIYLFLYEFAIPLEWIILFLILFLLSSILFLQI